MSRSDPILISKPPKGALADRGIALISALGLIASIGATLWFFSGFFETDPRFSPASSAFLLSIGLGAFAIIPCAVILRLSWSAWRGGFQTHHGVWTLVLSLPWLVFAGIASLSDWLPIGLTLGPLIIGLPCGLWAVLSLIFQRHGGPHTEPS